MLCRFLVLILFLCLGGPSNIKGQVYLQIEKINSTDLIRYFPGQSLLYSTKEYPDTWRKSKILKIFPEDQILILEDGYIAPNEIHSVRRQRPLSFRNMLPLIGWIARKLFNYKHYTMGKSYRLRIMDISFPAPKFETP